MDIEALQRMLDQMDPQEREQFLADLVASYGGRENIYADQMANAQRLRRTPGPGMLGNQRIQVAADPLAHLNTQFGRGMGDWQAMEARRAREEDAARRENALQGMMGALLNKPAGAGAMPAQQIATAQALRRMGTGR